MFGIVYMRDLQALCFRRPESTPSYFIGSVHMCEQYLQVCSKSIWKFWKHNT